MQCPNCNMNIKDDSEFCIHCGTHFNNTGITAQPSVSTNVCPNCNAVIQPGMQFCTNCGAQLNSQPVAVQQPTQVQQPVVNKPSKTKYLAFLLIPLIIVGGYFGITSYLKNEEMKKLAQEEFQKESDLYFQEIAVLASTGIVESEGKEPSSEELYYALIDDDIKDKEHPLTPTKEEDKGYFDGKGYVIIIMGDNITHVHGFVCLNNGNTDKRFISVKTTNVYERLDANSTNSFDKLKINEKGKCDISELLGTTNYPLHQLTSKEEKK